MLFFIRQMDVTEWTAVSMEDVNSIEMKFSSNLALTLVSSLFLDITQDYMNSHLRQLSFSLLFLLPTFSY